ncbi:MAG: iron ABC transporter permease [Acidobacteria bacterium]|nr:iron ABC transporter permease [Acidobacteriota bacterium]
MKRTFLVCVAAVWVGILVLGPFVGAHEVGLGELAAGDAVASRIIWQLRVPRLLLALLAGGALAVCGAAFQTLFGNPLAEPYTLGVAGGAALGAVLAQQLVSTAVVGGLPVVAVASFAGALAASSVIVFVARRRSTATLLLAGVAVALTSSALILFVQYLADFSRTFRMVRWMMGGLAVVGYREVLWVAPWIVFGAVALFLMRRELDQLATGEEIATSRGVDLGRLRMAVVAVVSLMVGALVAVTGPIGFVGLIVPHWVRRGVGHAHAWVLPGAFVAGGAFLALCDLLARRILAPADLPVGVLTAIIGGPFFLWLLLQNKYR